MKLHFHWMAVALLATMSLPVRANSDGQLQVESPQAGAMVYVDRHMIGPAPVRVHLPAGPHLVRVSINQDWFPFEDTIDVQPDQTVSVNANLLRSAWSFYEAGVADYSSGHLDEAQSDFHDSLDSPGKQLPSSWFYLGLLAERGDHAQDAAQDYEHYLNFCDGSVAGHYHLGLVEESLGETGRAATSYKLALLRLNPQFQNWMAAAPAPTTATVKELSQEDDPMHRLQLAYVQELKGNLEAARAGYRSLLEQQGADLNSPLPEPPPEDTQPPVLPPTQP